MALATIDDVKRELQISDVQYPRDTWLATALTTADDYTRKVTRANWDAASSQSLATFYNQNEDSTIQLPVPGSSVQKVNVFPQAGAIGFSIVAPYYLTFGIALMNLNGYQVLFGTPAVYATYTTDIGGNSDILWTASIAGTQANATTIQYVDPGTPNSPLQISVIVTSYAEDNPDVSGPISGIITVHLGTDGSSAITTRAADILTLVANATDLVSGVPSGGNGSGLLTALPTTALTGGTDPTGTAVQLLPLLYVAPFRGSIAGRIPSSYARVEITYTPPGSGVPTPIRDATAMLAASLFIRSVRTVSGISSETIGDYRYITTRGMRGDPVDSTIPEGYWEMIRPYINRRVLVT